MSPWKLCLLSSLVVLGLNVTLHWRFDKLEWGAEGVGDSDWRGLSEQVFRSHGFHGTFENRLRKLMEKSTDVGLDVIKIQNEAPMSVSYTENLIECEDFVKITNRTYLESGWTKAVYKGYYRGDPVAIKTVDVRGHHLRSCVIKGRNHGDCYQQAAQKIVKEIVVLQAIAHNNVVKVCRYIKKPQKKPGQGLKMCVTVCFYILYSVFDLSFRLSPTFSVSILRLNIKFMFLSLRYLITPRLVLFKTLRHRWQLNVFLNCFYQSIWLSSI